MITIWKTPIVATVEQVLKDLKLQLYGAGLLKEIKNTGSDLMCTCPFHANGKEHNPSCGVLLQQKVDKTSVVFGLWEILNGSFSWGTSDQIEEVWILSFGVWVTGLGLMRSYAY